MKHAILAAAVVLGLMGCTTSGHTNNGTGQAGNNGAVVEADEPMVGVTFPMPTTMKCLAKADEIADAAAHEQAKNDCMYARAQATPHD